MRNLIKIIIIVVVVLVSSFFLYKNAMRYNITPLIEKITAEVKYKGIEGCRSFDVDDMGNYYIATSTEVQVIDNYGKSLTLFKDKDLSITTIIYNKQKLYYISSTKLYSYNLKNKKHEIIMDNLPNFGDYKYSKILAKENYLYISIGSATNSGVVGPDNLWMNNSPIHDLTPKTIVLKGKNFNNNSTGAFVPYGTINTSGERIPAHFPGNASVIRVNTLSKKGESFCWGIRNIEGWDMNSKGKIYAVVGGMENRGLRPVPGDKDYIYELKYGLWYGWPDYSGGDPINSPRFRKEGEEKVSFILEEHPTTNPSAPFYQHSSVSSLAGLVVDKAGALAAKDSMFFYDSSNGIIYNITNNGILTKQLKLEKGDKINEMKFSKNSLLILDETKKCIFEVKSDINKSTINIPKEIMIFAICVIIGLVVILIINDKIK
ncbi:hypothetical protein CPJCM30710_22100 [Clostridium polyendosporum]|uniref:Glucose / Sorbosone dehydrogenase n=1 Tax=Clostridium polyendosporum TaxID=69208 RepID=A0A919S0C9_9CLOT|nr:hypothetical protein [Clostridium polyendosporum]GIM29544.1 hypothetical protein CPJCM30710_22100 [Clostridium polyendosporum]